MLGTAQTLAWASTYYLPAIIASHMAASVGVPVSWIFGAFSGALILSALLGPSIGRAIDLRGGRTILVASSAVFIAGLVLLGWAPSFTMVCAAWALLGIGMALGLYDSAFAALATQYGQSARGAITGVSLMAGFASTIGWPLSTFLLERFDWRETCLVWAALHLALGLPLNALLPKSVAKTHEHQPQDAPVAPAPPYAMTLLSIAFAASWFVTGSMAAHLPGLLVACGATPVLAVGAAALVGPAQVAARIAEWTFLRKAHPLVSGRLAALAHPIGACAIGIFGAPAIVAFTLLHGAGNGVLTIAKGTVPLAVFGSQGYGARQGLLSAPARFAQALAPFLFAIALAKLGAGALFVSAGLSLIAFLALMLLRPRQGGIALELPAIASVTAVGE